MARSTVLVAVLVLNLLLVTRSDAADPPTLKLGEKHEGRISGVVKKTPGVNFRGEIAPEHGPGQGYQTSLPVKLKAGDAVTISARALGDDRKVYVIVRDRTGAPIAVSPIEVGTSTLKIKEIADTDKHTIDVVSDRVGAFTLLVTTAEELSEKELEKKIAELEQQINELKTKLKEKQDKKPQK